MYEIENGVGDDACASACDGAWETECDERGHSPPQTPNSESDDKIRCVYAMMGLVDYEKVSKLRDEIKTLNETLRSKMEELDRVLGVIGVVGDFVERPKVASAISSMGHSPPQTPISNVIESGAVVSAIKPPVKSGRKSLWIAFDWGVNDGRVSGGVFRQWYDSDYYVVVFQTNRHIQSRAKYALDKIVSFNVSKRTGIPRGFGSFTNPVVVEKFQDRILKLNKDNDDVKVYHKSAIFKVPSCNMKTDVDIHMERLIKVANRGQYDL